MISFFFALLPAFFAALPLFGARFIPTHDGEYHLIRFWQFFTMLSHGYFFPRWAPDLNSGYGVPLFNFNYPFPNYIGSLFHFLGISFVDSVKWTMAAGYLSSVAWCYLFVKKKWGTKSAVFTTIIFSYVPYWFVDIYVRGSVGEVWAISFFLLTLTLLSYKRPQLAAFALCGLVLSHNILALMFVPIIALFIVVFERKQWRAMLLGLGLSFYFWGPAILERGYVIGLNSVNYQDHFPALFQLLIPSWGTGFSTAGIPASEMSFQIGVVSVSIALWSLVLLLKKGGDNSKKLVLGALICYVLAGFLMTDFSRSIWAGLAPILAYAQYPWRLLSITLVAVPILSGYLIKKSPTWIAVLLAGLAILFAFSYARPVTYEPRTDAYYLSKPNFTDGTSSMGNIFTPKWSVFQQTRPQSRFEITKGSGTFQERAITPVAYEALIAATTEIEIKANIAYYPGWKASIDDQKVAIDYQDGYIHVRVTPGAHRLEVRFTETPSRKVADGIALASLLWLLGSAILIKGKSFKIYLYAHRNKHDAASGRTQAQGNRRIHP